MTTAKFHHVAHYDHIGAILAERERRKAENPGSFTIVSRYTPDYEKAVVASREQ